MDHWKSCVAGRLPVELRHVESPRRRVIRRATELIPLRAIGRGQVQWPRSVGDDLPWLLLTILHSNEIIDVIGPDIVRVRIRMGTLVRRRRIVAVDDLPVGSGHWLPIEAAIARS